MVSVMLMQMAFISFIKHIIEMQIFFSEKGYEKKEKTESMMGSFMCQKKKG